MPFLCCILLQVQDTAMGPEPVVGTSETKKRQATKIKNTTGCVAVAVLPYFLGLFLADVHRLEARAAERPRPQGLPFRMRNDKLP